MSHKCLVGNLRSCSRLTAFLVVLLLVCVGDLISMLHSFALWIVSIVILFLFAHVLHLPHHLAQTCNWMCLIRPSWTDRKVTEAGSLQIWQSNLTFVGGRSGSIDVQRSGCDRPLLELQGPCLHAYVVIQVWPVIGINESSDWNIEHIRFYDSQFGVFLLVLFLVCFCKSRCAGSVCSDMLYSIILYASFACSLLLEGAARRTHIQGQ